MLQSIKKISIKKNRRHSSLYKSTDKNQFRRRGRSCSPWWRRGDRKPGLDHSAIYRFPADVPSSENDQQKRWELNDTECTICLSVIEEGDRVLLLPSCRHVFHVSSINTWLSSTSTCPVCRGGGGAAPIDGGGGGDGRVIGRGVRVVGCRWWCQERIRIK